MKESDLKKQVREWFGYHGWFCFPILQNLGAYKGISDLIAIKQGKVLFVELKTEKGILSEHQKKFKADIESAGGTYIVVRSIDDLEAYK